MQRPSVAAIIPAYNEAKTIHLILNKIKAVQLSNNIEKELIIVNDASSDGTDVTIEKYISIRIKNIKTIYYSKKKDYL